MRTSSSQLSFDDLELRSQGIHLDPLLRRISEVLDQNAGFVRMVQRDLQRGVKRPRNGRPGLSPARVVRSLVLMRIKNWDYRELRAHR